MLGWAFALPASRATRSMPLRSAPTPRPLLLLWGLLLFSSCASVEFYEKRAFSLWVMELEDSPTEQHLEQKVRYSTEGAAGGIGTKAGGGCGCY